MDSTLYTELDLVSEEEFLAQHPEYSGLEGHELMLKRLQDEADQRVELETRRKDLVNRRTATQADSKKRKNDLDNLTETLKKFIEVLYNWNLADLVERNSDIASLSKVLIVGIA
jgi:flagellar motility protein MotE (MotC chaperone)